MAKNVFNKFMSAKNPQESPTSVAETAFFPEKDDTTAAQAMLFSLVETFATENPTKQVLNALKMGANPYIKDNKQKSVFDYAKDANNLELMHIIYQNSTLPSKESKIITQTLEQATRLILESDNAPDLKNFLDQEPYLGDSANSYLAKNALDFALDNFKTSADILTKVVDLAIEQNPKNNEFKKALASKLVEYSNEKANILQTQIIDKFIASLDKETKDYKFGKLSQESKDALANFSMNSSDKKDVIEGTISKKDLISLYNSAHSLQDKALPEGIRSQIDSNIVQATNQFLNKQVEAGNLAEIIEISRLAQQNKAYMFERIGDPEKSNSDSNSGTLNKATFNLEQAQKEYDVEKIEIKKSLAVMLKKPSQELETQLNSSLSEINKSSETTRLFITEELINATNATEDKDRQKVIADSLSNHLKDCLKAYGKDDLEDIITQTDESNHHLLNVVMQNKDPKINLGENVYLKLTESASANNNSELLAAILKETTKFNQIDAVINADTLPPKTLREATSIIINDESIEESDKLKIVQAALPKINIYPELLNPLLEKAFSQFHDSQQTLADAVLKDPSTIKNLNQKNTQSLAMHYNPHSNHSPKFLCKFIDNEILDAQGKLKNDFDTQRITSHFGNAGQSLSTHVNEYITKKQRHEKKPILTWIDAMRDAKKLISPWNKSALEEYKNKQLEEPITKMQDAIKEKLPKPEVTPKTLTEEEAKNLIQQQETHKKIDAETITKIAAAEKNAESSRQKRSNSLHNITLPFRTKKQRSNSIK
jgi:hypothetical protein